MTNATLPKLSKASPAPTGALTNPTLAQKVLDAFDATSGVHPGRLFFPFLKRPGYNPPS